MPRVISVALDDEVYEVLIQETIRKYGNAKNVSRLVNDILKKEFRDKLEEYRQLYGFGRRSKLRVEELEDLGSRGLRRSKF